MKPIHLLAGLLAILAVLLDLVALAGFRWAYVAPLALLAGLVFGQMALLTCWCVLGRGVLPLRLLATLMAAYGLCRALGSVTAGSEANWLTLLALFAAGLAGALLFGRWLGLHLKLLRPTSPLTSPSRDPHEPDGDRECWKQFSLGSLLSVMTAVGMAIAVSRQVALPEVQRVAVASCGFWMILVCLTAFWALAARGVWINRWLTLVAVCLLSGAGMAQVDETFDTSFFTHMAFITAATICCGITLLQTADQESIFPGDDKTTGDTNTVLLK